MEGACILMGKSWHVHVHTHTRVFVHTKKACMAVDALPTEDIAFPLFQEGTLKTSHEVN